MMRGRRARMRFLTSSAMMAAFLSLVAPFTIPMGVLPMTLAVFALFLVASLSPVKVTFAAVATYLAIGALGLPVFASFSGGVGVFLTPSGGFLWGYLPAALLLSFLANKTEKILVLLLVMLFSLLLLYAFGLFGFAVLTDSSLSDAFWVAVAPFFLPDLLKIFAAVALVTLIKGKFRGSMLE